MRIFLSPVCLDVPPPRRHPLQEDSQASEPEQERRAYDQKDVCNSRFKFSVSGLQSFRVHQFEAIKDEGFSPCKKDLFSPKDYRAIELIWCKKRSLQNTKKTFGFPFENYVLVKIF